MKKKYLLALICSLFSLGEARESMGNCESYVIDERLPNVIEADMKLSASKVYGIDKKVIVQNGATLTIEPGTTLAGCSLFSYLVIAQDAKIIAKGTVQKPITFTSQMDLLGYSSKESAGEWGGLVIAGNAYTHYENNKYEADESVAFGSTTHEKDNESSGILEYVAIKHTGYEIRKDRELNGLSLAGVGSGTVVKNIAIIGGKDDGLEIWGGRVNIDGLYVCNAMDDSVDVDLGYRGEIKNVLVVQKSVDSKNNHDSSAMEFGNDENLIVTDFSNATLPTIKNLTAYVKGGGIYNKYDAGFRLENVEIISEKEKENELLFFRGKDSYDTGAKFLDGDVCFYNSTASKTLDEFFAKTNAKKPKEAFSAYEYFAKEHKEQGEGKFHAKRVCKGVKERLVWRGENRLYEAMR
ncbi:MAG: hypothetical protein JXQ67_11305 [Campylobacterales bacterium]|nr:hypothetical protein [Campylobacterales bacterium]